MTFGRLLGWYAVSLYTFSGALAPDGILPGAIFTVYVQVLRSPLLAAVPPILYGSPAAGVSQSLRRGTRNGITELSIFGRAAITLGIDPHCSCSSVLCTFRKHKMAVLADSKVSDVKVT